MTTTTETMTQAQADELRRLDHAIAQAKAELAQVLVKKIRQLRGELAQAETELARINANTRPPFTLTFPAGEVAILEVRGAADQESARAAIASGLFNCRYEIKDGDQTNGRAAYFYMWCSSVAQEQRV